MKNPNRVAELLTELKAECEYRFEFDAVNSFAQSLCEVPRVVVIDDRHQEFNGKRYHKRGNDGHYFGSSKSKATTLHREVWKCYFGEIPSGFVVHHVDEDKDNNDIENLRLVPRAEHTRLHNSDVNRFQKKKFICQECGKEYEAFDVGKNKFCSRNCTQKNFNRTHPKIKICQFCGKEFRTHHSKSKYCSGACASKDHYRKKN